MYGTDIACGYGFAVPILSPPDVSTPLKEAPETGHGCAMAKSSGIALPMLGLVSRPVCFEEMPGFVHGSCGGRVSGGSGLSVPLFGQVRTAFFVKQSGEPVHGAGFAGVDGLAVPALGLFHISFLFKQARFQRGFYQEWRRESAVLRIG